MDISLFENLLKQPESPKLDFKSEQYRLDSDYNKSQLIKDIICMANSNPADLPAYIVIGVQDIPEEGRRTLKGVDKHHDDAELQRQLKDKVEPVPTFLYRTVTYGGKQFGVIEIQPGYRLYQCRKDYGALKARVFYTRKGSDNREATGNDLEELFRDRARHQRDRTLAELSLMQRFPQPTSQTATTWTPQWYVQDLKVGGGPDERIELGRLVVVRFQSKPSYKWKDPAADIQGFWDENQKTMTGIKRPLIAIAPNGIKMEVKEDYVPLCIPGLDVDVEWREETHVESPIWGSIKRYIVQNFLRTCQGKNMICQVIYIGLTERGISFHLNCPDYDRYLNYEWPYYRGLENALAKNRLYKHPGIVSMSEANLRSFITSDLITSGALERMVPEHYKSMWHGRNIDTESAFLMLRGLIQQYLKLAKNTEGDKSLRNTAQYGP